MTGTSNKRHFD